MKKRYLFLLLLTVGFALNGIGQFAKAAATQAVWTVQPGNSLVGATISGNGGYPAVSIEDSLGNVITGDNTSSVTVVAAEPNATTQAAAGGALAGTVTKTVSSGVAIFNDLSFPSVGVIVLRADVSGLTSGVSVVTSIIAPTSSTAKAPTSAITAPANGAVLTPGSSVMITGTVTQGSTSSIQKVELTFNGGNTWTAANLTASNSWSYAWTVPASGVITIQSRATDWLGKVETPSAGITVTVAGTPTPTPTVVPTPTPLGTPVPAPTPTPTPSVPAEPANGTLVQVSGSPTVYMVVNGVYRPFISAAIFHAHGKKFSDIQIVSAAQIQGKTGKAIGQPAGTAIKGSSPTVYLVTSDLGKQGIPSMSVFNKLGLSLNKIVQVKDADLPDYPDEGVAQ